MGVGEAADRLVRVTGELDVLTSPEVSTTILARADACGGQVDVDLADVTFMDSSGLHTLTKLKRQIPNMRVANPSPHVARIIEITGLTALLIDGF